MAIVLPKLPSRRLSIRRAVNVRRSVKVHTEPAIGVRLRSLQQGLEPGETLEFEYCLKRVTCDKIDRLEVSVIWYTEGKGSEDLGVHLFESLSRDQLAMRPLSQPRLISTKLPTYPLSYEGRLLKIRWCVRLRLFLTDNREFTAQRPFYLGHLTVEV